MLLFYGIILIILLALLYYYRKYSFEIGILLAIVIWFLFLKSGIHPTIAGVLLAFTIPIKRKIDLKKIVNNLTTISSEIGNVSNDDEKHLLTKEEIRSIDSLNDLTFKVRSPLQHLEHKLHGWVAYFILPVFAFANAGVVISADYNFDIDLIRNIIISLFVGKFIGVSLFAYLGIKFKLTELPKGLKFKQIIGVAAIAGVGFTMSIFIDHLAFSGDERSINSVKVGIIVASLISGIVGYTILRLTSKERK